MGISSFCDWLTRLGTCSYHIASFCKLWLSSRIARILVALDSTIHLLMCWPVFSFNTTLTETIDVSVDLLLAYKFPQPGIWFLRWPLRMRTSPWITISIVIIGSCDTPGLLQRAKDRDCNVVCKLFRSGMNELSWTCWTGSAGVKAWNVPSLATTLLQLDSFGPGTCQRQKYKAT